MILPQEHILNIYNNILDENNIQNDPLLRFQEAN